MTSFQKRVTIAFAVVACLAAMVGLWSLRAPLIAAAQAELQARKIHWFQVLGTRIPCHDTFDIGVTVMFKNSEQGELIGGRLCRFPWANEWNWHPDPGDARPKNPQGR